MNESYVLFLFIIILFFLTSIIMLVGLHCVKGGVLIE